MDSITGEAILLELVKLDKSIKLDIRYARTDNFVGKAVYDEPRAFLQRPAAEALVRVHRSLKQRGLGLLIFDGYRPWSVTKFFWDVTPEPQRIFVADPKTGSRHNRGCAVDLSLYDLRTGDALPMPSDFDEFTEHASPDYKGGTDEERANRDLLRSAMEAEEFTVNANEWWHYDYKTWQSYPIYDVSFDDAGALDQKPKQASVKVARSWKRFFDDANVAGGMFVYDLNKNRYMISDRDRFDRPFSPLSTSEIIHSLIFLDAEILADETEVLKWDGVKRGIDSWNRDHDLESAFKASADWFYLENSLKLTRRQMQDYYDAADYANRSTAGFGGAFWVNGELAVTPRQQIEFLVKLHRKRLPFSPQVIDIVKGMMIEEQTPDYTLRAKTGLTAVDDPNVGWWIGYVETTENAYFFATGIDAESVPDRRVCNEITRAILKFEEVI